MYVHHHQEEEVVATRSLFTSIGFHHSHQINSYLLFDTVGLSTYFCDYWQLWLMLQISYEILVVEP